MENIKKTLLLVTLLAVGFGQQAQARTVAPSTGYCSWLAKTAGAIASKTLPALGTIGTAAASSFIPFGLGPVATVAAPYLIAAGANYITKKVSGVDLAEVKYREELKDEVGRLSSMMRRKDRRFTKMMRKIKKLRRSRKRREEQYMDEDEGCADIDEDYDKKDCNL